MRSLLPLLLALCVASPALADRREDRLAKLSPEERARLEEETRQKLNTFLTVELASRLGLDQATALKLSDAMKAHQAKQQAARKKMKDEYRKLEGLLDKKADANALRAQTKLVATAADARPDVGDLLKDTEKILNAEQQAKLVLAFPKVMKEMKRMMRHGRGKGRFGHRGAPEPPAPPARPGFDDDDDG